MLENAGIWIAAGAFILSILCAVVSLVWRISRLELSLRNEIRHSSDEVDRKHEAAARELQRKHDAAARAYEERNEQNIKIFVEASSAMRQKIHEVELWARDTFVRRDGYYKVQEAMETSLKVLGDKIDARLERMEAKIDSKT